MPSTFVVVTETRHPVEALFDISLDIDAHVASASRSRERAIAGVVTGRIGAGETVTWRARHFGIWFELTSRISEWERPRRFVDEQIRGPFRIFRHEHVFERAHGTTRMTDRVTVAAPVLGVVIERLVLVPHLRRFLKTRNAHLLRLLDGPGTHDPSRREAAGEDKGA